MYMHIMHHVFILRVALWRYGVSIDILQYHLLIISALPRYFFSLSDHMIE